MKDGKSIGYITSGGFAHYVKKSIAYSYLDEEILKMNEKFQVEINGNFYNSTIIKEPLYDPTWNKNEIIESTTLVESGLIFSLKYVFFMQIKSKGKIMKIRKIIVSILSVMLFSTFAGIANAGCGKVVVASQNWASAELMAEVDKAILEKGFGCEVELIPGATMPTFASMDEKGAPDMNPEQWANAVFVPLKKAVEEGRLVIANKAPITGLGEGWWLTPGSIEKHPELKGMTAVEILEHPEWFPSKEDPSKGAFVGCPAGWGCQLANAQLFRAFEMEKKGWVLIDPGSAAGLDGTISKAAESGDPWIGYYWNPTSIVGKYNLQPIPWGIDFAGRDNWDKCITVAEQDCADPKPSAWTHSEVNTIITAKFAKQGGKDIVKYIGNRTYPGPVMNGMLVWMADNQAGGSDAAIEFLSKHEDVWSKWVSSSVAKKVKAGL